LILFCKEDEFETEGETETDDDSMEPISTPTRRELKRRVIEDDEVRI
jgi:hypothetical protein